MKLAFQCFFAVENMLKYITSNEMHFIDRRAAHGPLDKRKNAVELEA